MFTQESGSEHQPFAYCNTQLDSVAHACRADGRCCNRVRGSLRGLDLKK